MASNDADEWRRKMVVQNIPSDWSKDLLENYMEVVTKAELDTNDERYVEYFCDAEHTALLTFTQPLTDQHIENAEAETERKGKPLKFSLLRSPPASIIVRDLSSNITRDNLFYYFDSPRAGGGEGEVKDCQLYASHNLAIVTFSSQEVAARVLAIEEHSPSKGTTVHVEPCYDVFHKQLLSDPKQQNSPRKPQPGRSPKPHFLPKQQSAPSRPPSYSHGSEDNFSRDSHHSPSYSDSRQQRANLEKPRQHWEGESEGRSLPNERGNRRGRRKNRSRGRGRGNYKDPAENAWDDGGKQNARGWGRGYGGNWGRPSTSGGRGSRGRGLRTSQSYDEQLSSYEPAYENQRGLSSYENRGVSLGLPTKPSKAPIPLVKLDANCDPIAHDAVQSESASDQFASLVETDGPESLSYDVYSDCREESLHDADVYLQSFDNAQREPEKYTGQGSFFERDLSANPTQSGISLSHDESFRSFPERESPDCAPREFANSHLQKKSSQFQSEKKFVAQKQDVSAQSSHTSNIAFLRREQEEKKRQEASRKEEERRKEQEQEAEKQRQKMMREKLDQEREVERLEQLRIEMLKEKERTMEARLSLEKQKQEAEKKVLEAVELAKMYEKQVEELKNRKKWTENFPPYQLRLLHDFAASCPDIQMNEKGGIVEFHGTQENYNNIKCRFLLKLQNLAEDSRTVSAVIARILQTVPGQQYLNQISSSDCSFDVKDSVIVCAAHNMKDVQDFLTKVEGDVTSSKVKVNKSITAQLPGLKQRLENDFPLARLTLPGGSSDYVIIEGLNGDANLAARAVKDFCSENQPATGVFRLTDPLEVKALKMWCSDDLEQVKGLIWKNDKDVPDYPGSGGFVLPYQCDKGILDIVQENFDAIRKVTKVMVVNLGSEFSSYSEKSLVINGLHNHGAEAFCRLLEDKLKSRQQLETIISLNVPPKCKLPIKLSYTQTQDRAARPARPHPRQASPRKTHRLKHGHHRSNNTIHPYSTKVGQSTLTVKSGNIALEDVDALVCVVGEDMDLSQTAVGSAILKNYPQAAQVTLQQGNAGQVKTVRITPGPTGQQSATVLFFAILTKWQGQNLQAQNIKLMVQLCLQSAAKQGIRTVAFPPLGVGRKFQLPEDTVASAMVSTAHQFLQNNRGTLQGITFVIYDTSVARKFRETARNLVQPPPPQALQALFGFPQAAGDSGSDGDNDSDNDDDSDDHGYGDGGDFVIRASDHDRAGSDEDAYGGQFAYAFDDEDQDQIDPMVFDDDTDFQPQPYSGYEARVFDDAQDFQPTPSNRFEARLCLQQPQHFQAVKTALCQELKSTFIFEDRIEDTKTFKKLRTSSFDDIKAIAARKDVVLDFQTRGGKEVLVARGQKVSVMEVMGNIKDKIHAQLAHHAQRSDAKDQRLSLRDLPSESDRKKLPSYWTICQKGLFKSFDQWLRKKMNSGSLYPVTQGSNSEYTEIINLINSTWVHGFVGHGKDGRNLTHKSIQVVKVERLENPNLWELYCMRRERLVRTVQTQESVFVPVERLRGSTGVVKTTSNLASGSLLTRDVLSKVNEHYLFHGTKQDVIDKIVNEGLDSRIANDQAMLGPGIYASESPTKADQYTDPKTQRTGGNKTMILMRVLLGEPFINKNGNPTKYKRAPCKKCFQDRCVCKNNECFDSVIDDYAGRNFREFVVYSQDMCYPEYIITYQRV